MADSSPTQRALPLTLHSLVAIDRNRWSPSIGMTGRLQSEQVVANTWCTHAGRSGGVPDGSDARTSSSGAAR